MFFFQKYLTLEGENQPLANSVQTTIFKPLKFTGYLEILMMKRSLIASAILMGSACAYPTFAQEAAAPAAPVAAAIVADSGIFALKNFSSSIYLTTNYMFRGISNSDGPAIQGSLDYAYDGFFAGVWASNTEFSDSNLEIDYYGGYRFNYMTVDITFQGLYYSYPGENINTTDGFDPINVQANYGEFNLGLAHTFDVEFAPSVAFNYYYTPNNFGEDGPANTVQLNLGATLPKNFGVYSTVGYSVTNGDKSSGALGGYSYVYYSGGVTYLIKGFKLDAGYVGTNESSSLQDFYPSGARPNFGKLVDGSFVFTVSRTF